MPCVSVVLPKLSDLLVNSSADPASSDLWRQLDWLVFETETAEKRNVLLNDGTSFGHHIRR